MVKELWRGIAMIPTMLRFAVLGAAVCGVVGGIVGLVMGLDTYAPTAWFAVFEISLPAAILGAALGFLMGGCVLAFRFLAHRTRLRPDSLVGQSRDEAEIETSIAVPPEAACDFCGVAKTATGWVNFVPPPRGGVHTLPHRLVACDECAALISAGDATSLRRRLLGSGLWPRASGIEALILRNVR